MNLLKWSWEMILNHNDLGHFLSIANIRLQELVVVYNRNYDLHNGAVLEVLLKTGKLFSKRLSREPGLVNTIFYPKLKS
jgi:hypothetical protein